MNQFLFLTPLFSTCISHRLKKKQKIYGKGRRYGVLISVVCVLYSVLLDSALQVMAVMVLILATKFSISKLVVCVWCLYSKVEKFVNKHLSF